MLPRSAPRFGRRRSADSLHSGSSTNSLFDDMQGSMGSEETIAHADVFLDDHLPQQYFHQDLIRLIHVLRIPGWSQVTLAMTPDCEIGRINGALTNSVYSVKPPPFIKEQIKREYAGKPYHHRLPPNLLLRVYGPQVGFLIDREKELQTVAELTKHNIGPQLLGTFTNGRFEQFLNAKPLTKFDLRQADTSIQIAKRMRDLHDNVPLMPSDAASGPKYWSSFEKWAPKAQAKLEQLDRLRPGTLEHVLHRRTFEEFLAAVNIYQQYLIRRYGSHSKTVFCHNDTQYGNILRLEPPRGSPLLRPQNEHRQLVVIDFEYSGPNNRAYDIANHFCEWMSDYHHPTMPHHIWRDQYPNAEEQRRFVESYVEHGAVVFDDDLMEREINELIVAADDYLPAVSMCWAMWGIVQTPDEEDEKLRAEYLDQHPDYMVRPGSPSSPPPEEELEFDSLEYAREKLALFWDDFTRLTSINKE